MLLGNRALIPNPSGATLVTYFSKFCDARPRRCWCDKMASALRDFSLKIFIVFLLKLKLGKYFVELSL